MSSPPGLIEIYVGTWNVQASRRWPNSEPQEPLWFDARGSLSFVTPQLLVQVLFTFSETQVFQPLSLSQVCLFWSSFPAFLVPLPLLSVALAYMSERPVHSNVLPSGSHGVCASLLRNLAEFAISDAD